MPQVWGRSSPELKALAAGCTTNMMQSRKETPTGGHEATCLQPSEHRDTSLQVTTALFNGFNVLKHAGKRTVEEKILEFI